MPEEENKSVGWVVIMLALVVFYFGWAFLAAAYFQADPTGAREANFWANSIAQLPNAVSVIGFGFRERFWLIGIFAGLEVGVLILAVVMKKMERELWGK